MSINEKIEEARLHDIYYDPASPGSLAPINKLRQAYVNKYKTDIPIKRVAAWLESQPTHQKHKRVVRSFSRNPIVAYRIDELWQGDLLDYHQFSRQNRGAKFLFCVIDVLSRFAWVRALRDKNAKSTSEALENIHAVSLRKPQVFQCDPGKEFDNLKFIDLVEKKLCGRIHFFETGHKAHCAERFIGTLRQKIEKHKTATQSNRYIDALPAMVESYNNSVHRMLKMTPGSVTSETEQQAFENLYGQWFLTSAENPVEHLNPRQTRAESDLEVGDLVRIPVKKSIFSKGSHANYSDQVYRVKHKNSIKPRRAMYTLEHQGPHGRWRQLKVKRYAIELSKVQGGGVAQVSSRDTKTTDEKEKEKIEKKEERKEKEKEKSVDDAPVARRLRSSALLQHDNA